jgi:hypothetical protein
MLLRQGPHLRQLVLQRCLSHWVKSLVKPQRVPLCIYVTVELLTLPSIGVGVSVVWHSGVVWCGVVWVCSSRAHHALMLEASKFPAS